MNRMGIEIPESIKIALFQVRATDLIFFLFSFLKYV